MTAPRSTETNPFTTSPTEKAYLSFIESFGNGLYILDEPEAALSQRRQLELMSWMMATERQGAQYIIVSHSPMLLGYPGADIISFDKAPLERIAYEDTDCYRLTRMFLDNRDEMLSSIRKSIEGKAGAD